MNQDTKIEPVSERSSAIESFVDEVFYEPFSNSKLSKVKRFVKYGQTQREECNPKDRDGIKAFYRSVHKLMDAAASRGEQKTRISATEAEHTFQAPYGSGHFTLSFKVSKYRRYFSYKNCLAFAAFIVALTPLVVAFVHTILLLILEARTRVAACPNTCSLINSRYTTVNPDLSYPFHNGSFTRSLRVDYDFTGDDGSLDQILWGVRYRDRFFAYVFDSNTPGFTAQLGRMYNFLVSQLEILPRGNSTNLFYTIEPRVIPAPSYRNYSLSGFPRQLEELDNHLLNGSPNAKANEWCRLFYLYVSAFLVLFRASRSYCMLALLVIFLCTSTCRAEGMEHTGIRRFLPICSSPTPDLFFTGPSSRVNILSEFQEEPYYITPYINKTELSSFEVEVLTFDDCPLQSDSNIYDTNGDNISLITWLTLGLHQNRLSRSSFQTGYLLEDSIYLDRIYPVSQVMVVGLLNYFFALVDRPHCTTFLFNLPWVNLPDTLSNWCDDMGHAWNEHGKLIPPRNCTVVWLSDLDYIPIRSLYFSSYKLYSNFHGYKANNSHASILLGRDEIDLGNKTLTLSNRKVNIEVTESPPNFGRRGRRLQGDDDANDGDLNGAIKDLRNDVLDLQNFNNETIVFETFTNKSLTLLQNNQQTLRGSVEELREVSIRDFKRVQDQVLAQSFQFQEVENVTDRNFGALVDQLETFSQNLNSETYLRKFEEILRRNFEQTKEAVIYRAQEIDINFTDTKQDLTHFLAEKLTNFKLYNLFETIEKWSDKVGYALDSLAQSSPGFFNIYFSQDSSTYVRIGKNVYQRRQCQVHDLELIRHPWAEFPIFYNHSTYFTYDYTTMTLGRVSLRYRPNNNDHHLVVSEDKGWYTNLTHFVTPIFNLTRAQNFLYLADLNFTTSVFDAEDYQEIGPPIYINDSYPEEDNENMDIEIVTFGPNTEPTPVPIEIGTKVPTLPTIDYNDINETLRNQEDSIQNIQKRQNDLDQHIHNVDERLGENKGCAIFSCWKWPFGLNWLGHFFNWALIVIVIAIIIIAGVAGTYYAFKYAKVFLAFRENHINTYGSSKHIRKKICQEFLTKILTFIITLIKAYWIILKACCLMIADLFGCCHKCCEPDLYYPDDYLDRVEASTPTSFVSHENMNIGVNLPGMVHSY